MLSVHMLEQWLQNRLLLVAMGLGVAGRPALDKSGEFSSCLLRPATQSTVTLVILPSQLVVHS